MFLTDIDPRPLADNAPAGIQPGELFLGRGDGPLQVALFTASRPPTRPELRDLHDARKRGGVSPVLVVVLHSEGRAAVATHTGLAEHILEDIEASQAERLCAAALRASDRHAAYRLLGASLDQLDSPVPGLRNEGLFAMHELEHGVPTRPDWARACSSSASLLPASGRALIEQLGYRIEQLPGPAAVLVGGTRHVAIAVFLERQDQIEPASVQFDQLSPISYALAKADEKNLDYVVVTAGRSLRVYPVRPGVGTGRRGRTETFIEFDLTLLRAAQAGYLTLLVSADALAPEGSFSQVLATSREFAVALGERLRDRVYTDVLPGLANAMVLARRFRNPTPEKLAETYEMALLVLFRLLFVAYAEDKELLPLHSNASYRAHSLKEIAQRLARECASDTQYERGTFYWTEVAQLWRAVDKGNRAWGVPAYNGGLFSSEVTPAAEKLAEIELPDDLFVSALRALLLDASDETTLAPIDFRSLGVREFGTIYEGLLEQELAVAERDLGVDRTTGAYVPTGRGVPVVVPAGRVYLHNASGARKASGAYYTKDFAVEHLLDHTLDPALDEHLARLSAHYDDRDKADRFFAFHVADIAMGSGHFLVAAIDHIERKLSGYLAKQPLAGVRAELERLRAAAREALGEEYRGDAIEDTQLLRRQIARRCIFGVDLNPLAVELARLSIWIHTFVPGLPLSFLDQNLVVGNSLVGIATFEEAEAILGGGLGLFGDTARRRMEGAKEPLERLGRLSDATVAEVKEAKKLYATARAAIKPVEELFTVLAAARIDRIKPSDSASERAARLAGVVDSGSVAALAEARRDDQTARWIRRADKVLAGMRPLHFPVAFPQVFVSERSRFDVLLGNPPWEEATVEEDAFWARHSPGMRSLPQREQEAAKETLRRSRPDLHAIYEREVEQARVRRELLLAGNFPGMGTGDPDLYKAFSWRFWSLVNARDGRIGVVLPRSAFAAKGSTEFRRELFENAGSIELTLLINNSGWLFANVHPQYTVALASIKRGDRQEQNLALDGPYASLTQFRARKVAESARFSSTAPATWNDTLSLPLLPTAQSVGVFAKLRRSPRLDLNEEGSWRARPHTELHATNDKEWMDLESAKRPRGFWPVFKGESFDLWTPDTGSYYAWADPGPLLQHLQAKRERSARSQRSPFEGFGAAWLADVRTLPCQHARIVFRDITNRTNQRTVIAGLIPPRVLVANTAPYLLWPRGSVSDVAYVLGVLSSIPLDWYARRFVETHVNFFVFNPLPVPRPRADSRLRQRVASIAARLSAVDDRFAEWAEAHHIEPAAVEMDEREDLVAELDASVSLLYGLDEGDVRHLFETFHVGWDFEERLRSVLAHYQRLRDAN